MAEQDADKSCDQPQPSGEPTRAETHRLAQSSNSDDFIKKITEAALEVWFLYATFNERLGRICSTLAGGKVGVPCCQRQASHLKCDGDPNSMRQQVAGHSAASVFN